VIERIVELKRCFFSDLIQFDLLVFRRGVIFGYIFQGRNASCDAGCTVILAQDDTTLSLQLQLSILKPVKYSATSLLTVNWGHQVSGIVPSPTVT
jgi:hypothetical protein